MSKPDPHNSHEKPVTPTGGMNLYQINIRVYLNSLGHTLGRAATLDDFPETELERLAQLGFDWVWLLGVWQTGPLSRQVAHHLPDLQAGYRAALPDLQDEDICGSCFAIQAYTVSLALGGEPALNRLHQRMAEHGLRLMLDFVPNHTALDHPWAQSHPEYFVQGRGPQPLIPAGYAYRVAGNLLAHGRDPYFPPWTDTLQLNYASPELQEAMRAELLKIAARCDGVRCDMAMLLLPFVFQQTWGRSIEPFWPGAIQAVKAAHPDFTFLAEVYWDLEWEMLQNGFDYTYDKRLYDRLREGAAHPVREHLSAEVDFQAHQARFLENHDEARAAAAFSLPMHQAAALLTYATPGLRFFHQGQFEGATRHLPMQLCRATTEKPNHNLQVFYNRLLKTLRRPVLREGSWRLLDCQPAWEGNWTWDQFVGFAWESPLARLVGVVNYGEVQGQTYLRLPFADLNEGVWRLKDLFGSVVYERDGWDLAGRGLYLDLPAWGYHLFELKQLKS
jgi:hypothetical protein